MRLKRVLAALCAGLTAAAVSAGSFVVSAANGYYTNRRIVIATEPGEMSEYVEYYYQDDNGNIVEGRPDQMEWGETGYKGQGLRLNGTKGYLRLGAPTMRVRTFTFATWIKWYGSSDPKRGDAIYNQSVFNICKKDGSNWFTFSPLYLGDERGIHGVYVGFKQGDTLTEVYKESIQGLTYTLPTYEWHHVAVVVSETELQLYIDGALFASTPVVTYVGDLNANGMYIGTPAFENGAPLNAMLDETYLFEYDLSAEQVNRMYLGIDPDDDVTPTPTSQTEPRPTAVSVTERSTVTLDPESTRVQTMFSGERGIFDLPLWGEYLIFGILGTVLVLAVILSILEIRRRLRRKRRHHHHHHHHRHHDESGKTAEAPAENMAEGTAGDPDAQPDENR
ncbi:MAG: LamG domain-containing protein [Clostridia bacterium]|nr:LamG domain-containing protein [Clostridia bacterium]